MRALVQRATRASVTVEGETIGAINDGFLILLGVGHEDTEAQADKLWSKISKSYGNAISISMTAEETAKRIKKSQTDSERMITFDPENRPGVSGLLSTAAICTGRSEVEIAEEIGMGGSGQLKKYVTEAVNEYFAPIRERRQRYENDLDYVKDVLHEGNRRANEIAEQTLAEVQDAMGMVY